VDLGLRDKAVICTGAAGGIGRATAHLFASEGARLLCADRDEAQLEAVVEALPGDGHIALPITLSGAGPSVRVVDEAVRRLGRVDVLAHLAAVLNPVALDDVTEEQWREHMAVNVDSTFFLARAAGSAMRSQGGGGRLVVLTSGAWLTGGLPTRAPYATTKGAVSTMLRSLAKAYGPSNITVNAVAPGLIDTAMMRAGVAPEQRRAMEEATPLGRFGTPEEVASVVVFLSSAQASFISGATVNVSGAYTLY
jgi:glucose 1-dehydrogenase